MKVLMPTIFLFLLIESVYCYQTGCILWENSFLIIENDTEKVLKFTISSRQFNGWVGLSFHSKENNFEDSFTIIGSPPSTIIQLSNHTTKTENTFFSPEFLNVASNSFDGIISFSFKINMSLLWNKNFIYFAKNSKLNSINNSMIFKHESFSSFRYFEFNSSIPIPSCPSKLNISARFFAQHYLLYLALSLVYFLFGFLMFTLRNEQPLKSRTIGPLLMVFIMYFNLFMEFFQTFLTVEQNSKYICVLYPFFTILQVSYENEKINYKGLWFLR
jgi:hypothetical protein